MSVDDRHREDVGAYLLGALEPSEQAAFEQHLAGCPECRADVEELRVATDALPRSVEPFAAPASLKRSLMEAVREDVATSPSRTAAPRRVPLRERIASLFGGMMRPELAWVSAAFILAVGTGLGVAVSALTGDGDGGKPRVVSAVVDRSRVSNASASVTLPDGGGPAQLRVTGLPKPQPGQVYEVWLKRGDQVQPGPLFNVDAQGNGVGAIPDDLSGVSAVLVTRERTGGAQKPSEAPIISARI